MASAEDISVPRDIGFLVDFVLPELTPYEFAVYIFLLRTASPTGETKIGKRTIAARLGKGTRSKTANYEQITDMLASLEKKGFIEIGKTTREGTTYKILPPELLPIVAAKLKAATAPCATSDDHFNDPQKRLEIFERDGWICQYCGQALTPEDSTLDHWVPRSKGGDDSAANLRACCLPCNSIKTGRTFEEAAADLLRSASTKRTKAATKRG